MSKAWPVPYAGLGAMAYVIELLMAVMGDGRRWRTMPWMVLAFGIVVVPLGTVSVFFIITHPVVIGTYCTLCASTVAAIGSVVAGILVILLSLPKGAVHYRYAGWNRYLA